MERLLKLLDKAGIEWWEEWITINEPLYSRKGYVLQDYQEYDGWCVELQHKDLVINFLRGMQIEFESLIEDDVFIFFQKS
jgi:hypothetical protein